MKRIGLFVAVLAIGCGGGSDAPDPDGPGSDAPGTDGPTADGPSAVFTLTSTAFAEGEAIPEAHTCNGANASPQLDWVNPPSGTLSFAMVLTDKSFNDFLHSVIYDVPANLSGLPADVDKVFAPTDVPGAHQTRSYNNGPLGYRGPCPPNTHTYEFALYALNVAVLPNLDNQSTPAEGLAEILMHDIAVAKLTGMYDPNQ